MATFMEEIIGTSAAGIVTAMHFLVLPPLIFFLLLHIWGSWRMGCAELNPAWSAEVYNFTITCREPEPEPGVFGSLEPEPAEKKTCTGAAPKKQKP